MFRYNTNQIRKILGKFKVTASINNTRKGPWIVSDVFRTQSDI